MRRSESIDFFIRGVNKRLEMLHDAEIYASWVYSNIPGEVYDFAREGARIGIMRALAKSEFSDDDSWDWWAWEHLDRIPSSIVMKFD